MSVLGQGRSSLADESFVEPPVGGATNGGEVLALRDVRFAYPGGPPVVDGISLRLSAGEILGVVGPSGCGKSTLLSLISGTAEPTSGTVERNLSAAGRHPLSMVFQKDTLLPWLTAAENVGLYAKFRANRMRRSLFQRAEQRKRRNTELDDRVQSLLKLAHLSDSARLYPYQLSGGMRRRLAFLTAVAPSPQLLLLDEPFSSVDEPTRVGIHQDVFGIARMMKMTTVLVTHDLAEAVSLCDRVIILSKRPTQIADEHAIPFGDDRVMNDLRATPAYLEVYGYLWHSLSEQMAAPARTEAQ